MKKLFLLPLLLMLASASIAHAQKIDYAPLEPLPGLTNTQGLNFAEFVQAVFKLLLTAGALLSVVVLVYGGIVYMVSGGNLEKGEAKKRIQAAFFGMALLLGAWLMLYTINPTLLNLDLKIPGNGGGGPSPNPLVVGSGSGVTVYTTGPLVPTAVQMQREDDKCKAKGLRFKPTGETGEDADGKFTIYKCQ